ncbi:4Fe-4S binding protein [Maribellus sediminis]|uniref:4Fe-4S binding protein n=1 Tax=Maribellus sediminis TaxID=2696285 RepID=UPI0014304F42|nr:4Fe-4S binding protein [Maribellus sediminis]
MKKNCVIYCNCGANIISKEKQAQISSVMGELKTDVIELHDLCAYSVHEKEVLSEISSRYEKKWVVACYPRAIDNMFRQNNITFDNYEVLNFRLMSSGQIKTEVDGKLEQKSEDTVYEVKKTSLDVPAWYPIIDEERCIYCGKCARFCVFGVYKFSKKSLEVVEPLNCKNNCPACGRTCPTSAIIFPRLPENSALSGAEPGSGEQVVASAPKDGLFVMLNERNKTRRSIFKNDMMQLAEDEKRKAIEELKKRAKE